ncbi:Transcriptional Coactivator p15 [Aphelenchoides besseyi]|nr:Transcriptional Coactivator p15 [Aphelenchoides besseyi]KAI6231805.1 Transcriptional Coactivator p15 [Aphelenchoides besseyi]
MFRQKSTQTDDDQFPEERENKMSDSDSEQTSELTKSTKKRVADDSGDEAKPSKKSKSEPLAGLNIVTNSSGEEMMEIADMKFVSVRKFKGKTYVDIREYYTEKNRSELKPGKKGISLTVDQYQLLKKMIPTIDAKLEA